MKAVVTVVGVDKPGIIARVSGLLFENGINIMDISQTIMSDMFTMIMLIDLTDVNIPVADLTEMLEELGGEMGLSIHMQREELFRSMHRI